MFRLGTSFRVLSVEGVAMRIAKQIASLAFAGIVVSGSCVSAQCQRGGQSTGSMNMQASSPYNQMPLTGGYNLNTLNPTGYGQSPLGTMMAMEQYNRNLLAMKAMQVQAQSQSVRDQVAQVQAMRKAMNKASAEKRKAAQQERAENLALREERESAKRSQNYETERSSTKLASVQ